ncbi:MAG: uridine kinase [Jatrophihabitans sp.]
MTPRQTTRDGVRDAIAGLPAGDTRYVGIDGFGAAGKTSLARWLMARIPAVVVVHVDDFAGPRIPEWDWDRLREQVLDPLRDGRPGRYQRWDWASDSGQEWHDVAPGGVVVIEGVSCTRQEVALDWNLTVWVATSIDIRRSRALTRDGADMYDTWEQRWIPREQAYGVRERPWERVDLVVRGDEPDNSDDGRATPQ